ncbi:helix-turn-helix domain-containing protein [Teredinibacter turnerae]|uniref:helix-turn-helix domain-containing protein n=2 Tax=Teredinibacter turnerae TaxID=2426 RepID=UPI001E4DEBA5|nr:helix-turn-helix domain-containing protein [Teredinibacter turnerae]
MSSRHGLLIIMELYLLPSIVAISAKIALFILGWKALRKVDKSLLGFFVGLFGVNIFELALMISLKNPAGTLFFMMMYYNCAILTVAFFFHYAAKLSVLSNRYLDHGIALIAVFAIASCSIPGLAIDGVESIGYSITRHAGPLYPVLQLTIVLGSLGALILLLLARRGKDVMTRRKSTILLVAVAPIIVSVIFVIVAMQFGWHLNATIIVSIETSFMMAVLFYTESQQRLFKLLAMIPSTEEHRQWEAISSMLYNPSLSLKEAQVQFAELYVQDAMRRAEGSQVKAAKLLGTSRSTVYRYLPSSEKEE